MHRPESHFAALGSEVLAAIVAEQYREYAAMIPTLECRVRAEFGHGGAIWPETAEAWGCYRPGDWGCDTPPAGPSTNTFIRFHYTGSLELCLMLLDDFAFRANATVWSAFGDAVCSRVVTFFDEHFPQNDAGGAMDPAEPELFEFGDDDTAGAGGKKVLSEKALKKARADQAKRGVVYLGSIPPFMKPQKLRQLLTPYGDLDRMYLMPEDPEIRARRKKFKGNTGKNFVEGWVEFRDKKKAKACAAMLNGTQVGGRRRGAHFSDLWNMKYLPKFKWDNLTEEIEYQKALREQRMQLELSVAKKERDFYLQKVEQAKQIEKMRERRAAEAAGDLEKLKHLPEAPPEDREETKEEYEARMRRERARQKEERNQLLRRFKQREALGDINVDSTRGMMSVDVLRDLFAGKKPDDE